MTGEQRHSDQAPDNIIRPATLSLADAYVAKVNAALGAGDDHLVIELAGAYLDETLSAVDVNVSAA